MEEGWFICSCCKREYYFPSHSGRVMEFKITAPNGEFVEGKICAACIFHCEGFLTFVNSPVNEYSVRMHS